MKHTTIKVYVETRRLLRLIAAYRSEHIVTVAHRLAQDEAARLGLAHPAAASETLDKADEEERDDE